MSSLTVRNHAIKMSKINMPPASEIKDEEIKDDDEEVKNPRIQHNVITRIARRGGVGRANKEFYAEFESVFAEKMNTVVSKALQYTELANRKTVKGGDIQKALETIGVRVAVPVEERKGDGSTISFSHSIRKISKIVNPDLAISAQALSEINSITNFISESFASEAARVAKETEQKETVGQKQIEGAVKLLIEGDALKSATLGAILKAQNVFAASSVPGDKTSKATRAGVSLYPSKMEHILRSYCSRVSPSATVALAAAVNYLISQILLFSGNITQSFKRKIINPRHVKLGMESDEELKEFANSLNICIVAGGIASDSTKPPPSKKKKRVKNGAKSHRWRPGTVAKREISYLERTYDLLIPETTFRRIISHFSKINNQDISRITGPAKELLQTWIENYLTELCITSVLLAKHAKRVTVGGTDITLAKTLKS